MPRAKTGTEARQKAQRVGINAGIKIKLSPLEVRRRRVIFLAQMTCCLAFFMFPTLIMKYKRDNTKKSSLHGK